MSTGRPSTDPPTSAVAANSVEPSVADARLVTQTATAVLGGGFQLGIAILTLGLILSIVQREPLAQSIPSLGEVGRAVADGNAAGVIDVAILWMIAVPVMAALAIAVAFFRVREWLFMTFTLLVLAVLGVSIGIAIA